MNKLTIAALILAGSIILGFVSFYFYAAGVRDNAVKNQETVNESWVTYKVLISDVPT